ncbi:hypothetical protein scyTo_0004982 [Scyliorhinus torazame]|uniref:Interleukin-17 receptor C/E N-terminal domain-containing protein n=1 Tax=Scyliorhinus torazame TaxID=75743 RepID=A0A401P0A0_SCYTO|nr:hypothetical protein [Scyliorhinus torazame]
MQPDLPHLLLLLLLWLDGIRSLETFRGPLLEASCPHQAFSCEAKYNCEQNNEANTLLLTNLTTSTILYCDENESCTPCIRVQLTITMEAGEGKWNLAGSGSISKRNNNVDTESEDEDYNEDVGLINITSMQPNGGIFACAQLKIQFPHIDRRYTSSSRSRLMGTVELSCFQTAVESEVQITAYTGVKRLQHMHKVEDCTVKDFLENVEWCKVPNISTTLEIKTQMAVIHVPQNYYTMFKYNVMTPFESPLFTEKLKVSDVPLNYSDIVPCLCVQVWSATIEDARRCEKCPFSELEEFRENIWKWSSLAVEYEGKALQWTFSSPCDMKGEISLCSRSGGGTLCQEIPHSRRTIKYNQRNEFRNVDPHPALCIKPPLLPKQPVRGRRGCQDDHSLPWEVDTKLKHRNVTLTISHRKKEMNFSICAVKGDKCEHVQPNVKMLDQKKQLDFVSQDCIQVWRSDVKFSPRITICPYEMCKYCIIYC